MLRVFRNLRLTAPVLVCVGLTGCSSSSSDDSGSSSSKGEMREGLISFDGDPAQPAHQGYSAFDGNVHDYQVVPNVPSAADTPTSINPDPVLTSSLVWTVDDAFVKKEAFSDVNAAVLLTTKKVGMTTIKVSGKTMSGTAVQGQATLDISQADPDEWAQGDKRYNNGMMIDWGTLFSSGQMMVSAGSGMSVCGLPVSLGDAIPKTSACGNCHNNMSGIAAEHTPEQTAGYSNDDLVQIFTKGMKPAGYTFTSNILKLVPMPECIYKTFHTWDIDEPTQRGIIWKLRSLKPMGQPPPPDAAQLAAMFRMTMMGAAAGAPAAGAAGSGM